MKAVTWCGTGKVNVERVPDPRIVNPRDAIVRVTLTAICGSDLHLYNGVIPTLKAGDILGHEFMGDVVEVGTAVKNLKRGDRVVVPFCIGCGNCFYCQKGLTAACDNSNPNAGLSELAFGMSAAGLFGYSHLYGGYAGGQAELVRVPYADAGPFKIPDGLPDEKALFLTDIFPTGYMAAENCAIEQGDVIAVWGCGPVGLFCIKSAFLLGAGRVIAIDRVPERLRLAAACQAETMNYEQVEVLKELKAKTGGRGPDACIDAVGMEAHGLGIVGFFEKAAQDLSLKTDRGYVLRQAIHACRKGGTVSIPGVYGGAMDQVPLGVAFAKGLTFKMGQTHVHRYLPTLLKLIQEGRIDPSFLITHRGDLESAPALYRTFRDKTAECIKVVMMPDARG